MNLNRFIQGELKYFCHLIIARRLDFSDIIDTLVDKQLISLIVASFLLRGSKRSNISDNRFTTVTNHVKNGFEARDVSFDK